MRPQKVSVDSWYMLTVSCGCIGLVIAVRVLLRLIQAIFWLPSYIEKMEKAVTEEQLRLKMSECKEMMQDPELDKEKADAREDMEDSGTFEDNRHDDFEELINVEQTIVEESSGYEKKKDV